MAHHRHYPPGAVSLDHALDTLGSTPSGLAATLGAWAVRRFGPVKAGQFADAVVKSVQIEIRKADCEAPFIDADMHGASAHAVSAVCRNVQVPWGGIGVAAVLIALLAVLSVASATAMDGVLAQVAAGAVEW